MKYLTPGGKIGTIENSGRVSEPSIIQDTVLRPMWQLQEPLLIKIYFAYYLNL